LPGNGQAIAGRLCDVEQDQVGAALLVQFQGSLIVFRTERWRKCSTYCLSTARLERLSSTMSIFMVVPQVTIPAV
jgi:hypothetical protein